MSEVVSPDMEKLEAALFAKLGNTELRQRIIEGCRDVSASTARYYLFWVAESIGLGSDRLDSIESSFEGYEEIDFVNWDKAIDKINELSPEVDIDELLNESTD